MEKLVDNLPATDGEATNSEGVVYDTDYRGVPDTPELYSNNYKDFYNYPHSIYPRAGAQADAERDELKETIKYDYFEQELPDRLGLAFVDLLIKVILSLRHENKPENRRLLAELDSLAVMEFMRRRDLLLKDFW